MLRIVRRLLWVTLLSLFALSTNPVIVAAQENTPGPDVLKVVYHADFADPRRFSAMLTSIYNMATTYEDMLVDYDIRIVFVAHGIRFITDNKLENTPFATDAALAERRENLRGRLKSLYSTKGIKLELCDITRRAVNVEKNKFYKMVNYVESGVVRVAELQRKGYAYLKVE